MTLTTIMDRVRQGFDVEKVTKTFYTLFKEEHANFLRRVENIPDDGDCEWYTSIMLNRLMFIYFIQKKGLLDNHSALRLEGKEDYLRERLRMTQEKYGPDSFYAFYRYFLRRLFHEGLSQPEPDHSPELKQIVGKVPYINGGLFDIIYWNNAIQISRSRMRYLSRSLRFLSASIGIWMIDLCAKTTRLIPMCWAISLRSTSTRSRWAHIIRKRTLQTISAKTRSFHLSLRL